MARQSLRWAEAGVGMPLAQAEQVEETRVLELEGRSQVGLSVGGGGDVTMPDYTAPGPFQPARLPRLEHTCSSCFPQCVGDKCRLRIDVTYPKVTPRAPPPTLPCGSWMARGASGVAATSRVHWTLE